MKKYVRGDDPCPCGSGKQFKNCHGMGQVSGDEQAKYAGNSHSLLILLAFALSNFSILYALRQFINARPDELGAYASWTPATELVWFSIIMSWAVSVLTLFLLVVSRPDFLANPKSWYGVMLPLILVVVTVPGYWTLLYLAEGSSYHRAVESRHAGKLRKFLRTFPDTKHASKVLFEMELVDKEVLLNADLSELGRAILSTSPVPQIVSITLEADTSALKAGPNIYVDIDTRRKIGESTTKEVTRKLAEGLKDVLPNLVTKYAIEAEWLDDHPKVPYDRPLLLISYVATYGPSYVGTSTGGVSSHTYISFELSYYPPGSLEPKVVTSRGVGPDRVSSNIDAIVDFCRDHLSDWEQLAAH